MILRRVPIASIAVRPQTRRQFDDAEIRGLAESIASVGLQQPLLCRLEHGVPVLIDGERRLRALALLNRTDADILIVEGEPGAADHLARQLVCNLQRADLRPVERAEGVRQLMDLAGLNAEAAAARLGRSPATISKWLAVLALPGPIKEQVDSGRIAADAAYRLSRIDDPAEQAALAARLADGQLTRDDLARRLKKSGKPGTRPTGSVPRVTAALGAGRSVTLAGTGLTLDTLIEWIEPLLARARKAKAQGLSLQTFVRTLRDQAGV